MKAPNILESIRSLFWLIDTRTGGSTKFMPQMFWAAALGCLLWPRPELGEFGSSTTISVAAVLACLALPLSLAGFSWDTMPLTASRLSLYGLQVAGEVLFLAGLVATAAGRPEGVEAWHVGFGIGVAVTVREYARRTLHFSFYKHLLLKHDLEKDNTPEDVGSKLP